MLARRSNVGMARKLLHNVERHSACQIRAVALSQVVERALRNTGRCGVGSGLTGPGMISDESAYQAAVARLAEAQKRLSEHRSRLKETGLTDEEIKRVIDPMESFHLQLKEEVESYERLNRS